MITLVANPKPFKGEFDLIQRNAIKSWKFLGETCEIILFDDEEGTTARVAKELGVKCMHDSEFNEYNAPLLSSVFRTVRTEAQNDVIAYVNADIILFSDFIKTVGQVREKIKKPFLMMGRRWDLDVNEAVDFQDSKWEGLYREKAFKDGTLHSHFGMDYWVFPKSHDFKIPPFAKGRSAYDNWLVYHSRSKNIPLIDTTSVVTAIHQNHSTNNKRSDTFKIEQEENIKLAGGVPYLLDIRHASHVFDKKGIHRPSIPIKIISYHFLFKIWMFLRVLKYRLRLRDRFAVIRSLLKNK